MSRKSNRAEIKQHLQAAHLTVGKPSLSMAAYRALARPSGYVAPETVLAHFGGRWNAALEAAGIPVSHHRHTKLETCAEAGCLLSPTVGGEVYRCDEHAVEFMEVHGVNFKLPGGGATYATIYSMRQKRGIPIHRAVMEAKLKSEIPKGSTVHHTGLSEHDNRPSRLELWDSARRHGPGQSVEDSLRNAVEVVTRYATPEQRAECLGEIADAMTPDEEWVHMVARYAVRCCPVAEAERVLANDAVVREISAKLKRWIEGEPPSD